MKRCVLQALTQSLSRLLLALAALGLPLLPVRATTGNEDDTPHHRINLTGNILTEDLWQVEVGYHWMALPYVGVGGAVGFRGALDMEGTPSGKGWAVTDDPKSSTNLYLRPSVFLVSPPLLRTHFTDFHLTGEAGLLLNIPYERVDITRYDRVPGIPTGYDHISSHKGRIHAFELRVGVSSGIDDGLTLSVGYQLSTLDPYAMRRELSYEGGRFDTFYPKARVQHGAYLSLSIYL